MHSSLKAMFKKLRAKAKAMFSGQEFISHPHEQVGCTPVGSCQIPTLQIILYHYLNKDNGVFVEVGAFDGVSFSNTYHLAAKGWHGIYCEPVKEYADKCRRNHCDHQNIRVIEAAISDTDDKILEIDTGGIFSTVNSDAFEYFKGQSFSKHHFNGSQRLSTHTLTLDTLIKKEQLAHIDLLVIDVEGHELSVLKGLSLALNRPSVIIIELQELQHIRKNLAKTYALARLILHQSQYISVYSDAINTIFVDEELFKRQNNLAICDLWQEL